jgi:hypothetical protein
VHFGHRDHPDRSPELVVKLRDREEGKLGTVDWSSTSGPAEPDAAPRAAPAGGGAHWRASLPPPRVAASGASAAGLVTNQMKRAAVVGERGYATPVAVKAALAPGLARSRMNARPSAAGGSLLHPRGGEGRLGGRGRDESDERGAHVG